ncbi:hypothetical protein DSUL_20251 [Desulfovibrionales bacterium]
MHALGDKNCDIAVSNSSLAGVQC